MVNLEDECMSSFSIYVHWFLFLKVVWIDWYWQYYIGRREILMNCTYILLTSVLALRMALNCTWSYRNNCSYLQLYFYSGIFSNLIEKKILMFLLNNQGFMFDMPYSSVFYYVQVNLVSLCWSIPWWQFLLSQIICTH